MIVVCQRCNQRFSKPPSVARSRMLCREACPGRKPEWNADIAWLSGVVASDGYLSKENSRRISVTSKDFDMIEQVSAIIPMPRYYIRPLGHHTVATTWSAYYDFLLNIGIMPAKSLTIGPVKIPDEWFFHFLRGEIDGDGLVKPHLGKYPQIRIFSASPPFLYWLQMTIGRLCKARSQVVSKQRTVWSLCYGGEEAMVLGRRVWPDKQILPALARKIPLWLFNDVRVNKRLSAQQQEDIMKRRNQMAIRAIARDLCLDRCTVRRFLRTAKDEI